MLIVKNLMKAAMYLAMPATPGCLLLSSQWSIRPFNALAWGVNLSHSLIISREGLILTLSILKRPRGMDFLIFPQGWDY